MAKITDQEIITYLKKQVAQIDIELSQARTALESIGGIVPQQSDVVIKKDEADFFHPPVQKKVIPLSAPLKYTPELILEKKIAFLLKEHGPLFNDDIIRILQDKEGDKDPDKIAKAVMVKLSFLYKSGRLKAKKVGRKFKYEL